MSAADFLTPILLLINWIEAKKAAGISALFILVNSISGLLWNYAQVLQLPSTITSWIIATIGGITGSTRGNYRFTSTTLRGVLAIDLLMPG